jgi:REP element-mobilizing transposase RayT
MNHRRSIRLSGYDYAEAGAYFITVCVNRRRCLFGDVIDGEMRLNDAGRVVCDVWDGLPVHYPNIELDAFVVMPNHAHGIVILASPGNTPSSLVPHSVVGAGFKPALRSHGLPEIVRGFKTFAARRINEMRVTSDIPVWQRNYYEHVIRNEESLEGIRQYIADNPGCWADDPENPKTLDGLGGRV